MYSKYMSDERRRDGRLQRPSRRVAPPTFATAGEPCGPDTVPERSEVGAGGAASDRVGCVMSGPLRPLPHPRCRGTVSRAVVVALGHGFTMASGLRLAWLDFGLQRSDQISVNRP